MNFLHVEFQVSLTQKDSFGAEGKDEVVFLISTNPGESVKPLAAIASGGELSRIMLALKTITAKQEKIGTFIFDEIDAGISGKTAWKVSEKLGILGRTHQIICITLCRRSRRWRIIIFILKKMQPTIPRRRRSQSCPRQTA